MAGAATAMTSVIEDWLIFALGVAHVMAGVVWVGAILLLGWLEAGSARGRDASRPRRRAILHGAAVVVIRLVDAAAEQGSRAASADAGRDATATSMVLLWPIGVAWFSGAALLILGWYAGASGRLVDPALTGIALWQGIMLSSVSVVVAWVLYDLLCESAAGQRDGLALTLVFIGLAGLGAGYAVVFTPGAVVLHVGIVAASLMTGNAILVVLPNQQLVLADRAEGRRPDADALRILVQRRQHNGWLALPVLVLMLGAHAPAIGAHGTPALASAGLLAAGALLTAGMHAAAAGRRGIVALWPWLGAIAVFGALGASAG